MPSIALCTLLCLTFIYLCCEMSSPADTVERKWILISGLAEEDTVQNS